MQQASQVEYTGQFESGGSQLIGGTLNTDGGNVNFTAPENVRQATYQHSRIGANARAHLGDQYHHYNGLTINASNLDINERTLQELAQLDLNSPSTRKTFGLCLGQAPQIPQEAFIGRGAELAQLQEWFSQDNNAQKVVSIVGMGCLGKTQLSIAYARKNAHRYTSVFWMSAKDELSLRQSMSTLAGVIQANITSAATNTGEEQVQIELVRHWLSEEWNKKWLVIFDNYDDPKLANIPSPTGFDIRSYFPHRTQGDILITTRSPKLTFSQQLTLQKVDDANVSLEVLGQRAGRDLSTDPDARRLANRLDGLLLALATAGTYIGQTSISCTEYLQEYESAWSELHGPDSEQLLEYEDRTLSSTWIVSFEQVCRLDADAAELFKLLAYFDNNDIWYELLRGNNNSKLAWLDRVTASKIRFDRAMIKLQAYSLIVGSAGSYSVHPIVHDWVSQYFDEDKTKFSAALRCIANNVPDHLVQQNLSVTRRTLMHVNRINQQQFRALWDAFTSNGHMLKESFTIGYLLISWGQLQRAEQVYLRVLTGSSKVLGHDDLLTLDTVKDLGVVYKHQDKLDQAETMLEQARVGYEKALGPDDIWTLATVNNLGDLYRIQGKLDKAEEKLQRALTGYEQVLGRRCIEVFRVLNNLGLVYQEQGKLDRAEEMLEQSLAGFKQVLGPDNVLTLQSVANLGLLYSRRGKLEEAENLLQQALAGYERELGPDNKSTLYALGYLGNVYKKWGKLGDAEVVLKRALARSEQAFVPDKGSTLLALKDLANLYKAQGKPRQAEQMLRRVLAGFEQMLGTDNIRTIDVVNNLGRVYWDVGKLDLAETMYSRAYNVMLSRYGSDHPYTKTIADNRRLLEERRQQTSTLASSGTSEQYLEQGNDQQDSQEVP